MSTDADRAAYVKPEPKKQEKTGSKKAAAKEARKKADVLCGVARADAEKTRAAVREQTLALQEELRKSAGANGARVAEEIRKIVLGKA